MTTSLFPEQAEALDAIIAWLASDEPFFVLSGGAGTGKTYCIRELVNRTKGRFVFTAPTNKATKELRNSVTTKEYKPECRTIFSLLGLRLEASGEIKELTAPEDPLDLSAYKAVVVDESSMNSSKLMGFIKHAQATYGVKFLFMGDDAQLPPVGETTSPVWKIPGGFRLQTVRRHDNQILELVTRIRGAVNHPAPNIKLLDNHDDKQGVWKLAQPQFLATIAEHAQAGAFSQPAGSKAIAWRNVTVDSLNKFIRSYIFPDVDAPWVAGDRVIFTAPAKDLDDQTVATTDDEGLVERVETEYHALYGDFKIHRISITLDTNTTVVARVLHPDSQQRYAQRVEELSTAARANPRKWKDFWAFKEAFHSLRHAYAITAHRAQGSTYDCAFVDWRDVLLNRNRQEAFRCLYVACSRPKRALVLN